MLARDYFVTYLVPEENLIRDCYVDVMLSDHHVVCCKIRQKDLDLKNPLLFPVPASFSLLMLSSFS